METKNQNECNSNISNNISNISTVPSIVVYHRERRYNFESSTNDTLGTIHEKILTKLNLGPYEFGYIELLRQSNNEIIIGSDGNSYYRSIYDYQLEGDGYKFLVRDRNELMDKVLLSELKAKYFIFLQENEDAKFAEQLNADMMCSFYNGPADRLLNRTNRFEQFIMYEALPRLLNQSYSSDNIMSSEREEKLEQNSDNDVPDLIGYDDMPPLEDDAKSIEHDILYYREVLNNIHSQPNLNIQQSISNNIINEDLFQERHTTQHIDSSIISTPDIRLMNILRNSMQEIIHDMEYYHNNSYHSSNNDEYDDEYDYEDNRHYDENIKVVLTSNEYEKLNMCKFFKIENKSGNDSCPICLESFDKIDDVLETKCSHIFHESCGKKWFTENSIKCPVCRVRTGKGIALF